MDFFVLCNLLVCRFFIGRVFPAPAGMNLVTQTNSRGTLYVFPAPAGMNRHGAGAHQALARVPRTRGDEPNCYTVEHFPF